MARAAIFPFLLLYLGLGPAHAPESGRDVDLAGEGLQPQVLPARVQHRQLKVEEG